jgi:hypothetical protein
MAYFEAKLEVNGDKSTSLFMTILNRKCPVKTFTYPDFTTYFI